MEHTHRQRRRRQERTACDTCRRRKTRCDLSVDHPCSLCSRLGLECKTSEEGDLPMLKARRPARQPQQLHHQPSPGRPSARTLSGTSAEESITIAGLGSVSHTTEHAIIDTSPAESTGTEQDRDKAADDITRSGLSKFFQQGVESTRWMAFDRSEVRIAYIGTPTSNLAHLVQLKQTPVHTLHLPHPPLRPPLPWKPEGHEDAACVPNQEVRDALVDAFFTKLHPGFPIIEESIFMAQYRDRSRPPSLLLLQAILLAGSHVCEHPLVASSRMVVTRTLYRRASMLFHLRHENDRLQMIQAALLFTWHLENADTICGGPYYWAGIATRIAHGMGLHRDLSASATSLLPASERRKYRRLWWTVFQTEVLSSLEHGRPCAIRLSDEDQPPPDLSDFVEGEKEQMNESVQFEYFSKNVRLSAIILEILNINAPNAGAFTTSTMASVEAALAAFAFDLPATTDFWSCQLRMHYNLALLHLHRGNGTSTSTPGSIAAMTDATRSRAICNDASQAILSCMETICNRGWSGQCSFTGVSAVMAAAIQITNDAKAAVSQGSALLALSAQNRLVRLLDFARELEKYWPSAGAVHGLFKELSEEVKQLARNVQATTSSHEMQSAVDGSDVANLALGWDFSFDSFHFDIPSEFEVEEYPGFLYAGLG